MVCIKELIISCILPKTLLPAGREKISYRKEHFRRCFKIKMLKKNRTGMSVGRDKEAEAGNVERWQKVHLDKEEGGLGVLGKSHGKSSLLRGSYLVSKSLRSLFH